MCFSAFFATSNYTHAKFALFSPSSRRMQVGIRHSAFDNAGHRAQCTLGLLSQWCVCVSWVWCIPPKKNYEWVSKNTMGHNGNSAHVTSCTGMLTSMPCEYEVKWLEITYRKLKVWSLINQWTWMACRSHFVTWAAQRVGCLFLSVVSQLTLMFVKLSCNCAPDVWVVEVKKKTSNIKLANFRIVKSSSFKYISQSHQSVSRSQTRPQRWQNHMQYYATERKVCWDVCLKPQNQKVQSNATCFGSTATHQIVDSPIDRCRQFMRCPASRVIDVEDSIKLSSLFFFCLIVGGLKMSLATFPPNPWSNAGIAAKAFAAFLERSGGRTITVSPSEASPVRLARFDACPVQCSKNINLTINVTITIIKNLPLVSLVCYQNSCQIDDLTTQEFSNLLAFFFLEASHGTK